MRLTVDTLASFVVRLAAGAVVLGAVSLAAPAAAADDAPKAPPRNDDVLRGPTIEDDAAKSKDGFGKESKEGKARAERVQRPAQQVRMWIETMKAMDLAPEQRQKVEAITRKFVEAREAFEKEHGEARRELEKKAKEAGRDSAEGKKVREELKALAEKAPKPEPFQTEAFAVLTPAQQESFKKSLAEREAKRKAMQEKAAGKDAGKNGAKPSAGGTGKGDGEMGDGMGDGMGGGKDGKPGDQPRRGKGKPAAGDTKGEGAGDAAK